MSRRLGLKGALTVCVLVALGMACATPANATVLTGSRVVFVGDYETGEFSQWNQCQNRKYSASCSRFRESFYGMQVETAINRQGRYAARYEVRNGDSPSWGGGERAEVARYDVGRVYEGDERWYEFSLLFDTAFPAVTGDFFVVMQWHAGSGPPPMTLMVDAQSRLVLDGTGPDAPTTVIGDIARGQWVDYVVHVRFGRSISNGWAEVYRNGVLAVPRHARDNMSSRSNYLKMGIYRDSSETTTAVMWQDGLRVIAP